MSETLKESDSNNLSVSEASKIIIEHTGSEFNRNQMPYDFDYYEDELEEEVMEIEPRMMAIARSNKSEINFVVSDMNEIAKSLSDENFDIDTTENGGPREKMERFSANTVLASFYLHSYSLATLAFNAMMEDKKKNPLTQRTIVDYFAVEAARRMKK